MDKLGQSLRSLVTRYNYQANCQTFRTKFTANNLGHRAINNGNKAYYSTLIRASADRDGCGFIKVAPVANINLNQRRFKKKKAKGSKQDDEAEEDDDDDDELANENPLLVDDILDGASDGSETLNIDINSLRLDSFCKVAFGVARAKVEEAFYKGEIRVNGKLPAKKSVDIMMGDEVDLFKSIVPEDSRLINVRKAMVVQLPDKATEHGRMKIKIKRWQDVVIEKPDDSAKE